MLSGENEVGITTGVPLWAPYWALSPWAAWLWLRFSWPTTSKNQADLIELTDSPLVSVIVVLLTTAVVLSAPIILELSGIELTQVSTGVVFVIGLLIIMLLGFSHRLCHGA